MQELRANTQVVVTVGPFVDVGDGFTPQTDITLGGNEAELLKHGSDTVVDISAATWAAVANCRGYYSLTLTTAHTNTEGMLVVIVQDDSDTLPVKQEYMVLSEAAYDSKYVAKDDGFMDVNIKTIGRADTQETEANNLESACSNYSVTRGLTGTAVPAAVADANNGLVTGDGSVTFTAGVGNRPAVDVEGLGGTVQSADDLKDFADEGYNPATNKVTGVVLTDTCTTLTGHTDQTGDSFARLGGPAGASVSADIAAIEAQTDDIGVAGAGLTDLGGMSAGMMAEIESEVNDALDTAISELGVAAPTATPTVRTGLMLLYMALRNKLVVQTSGVDAIEIHNNAGAKIAAKLITDAGGDYTEAEMA